MSSSVSFSLNRYVTGTVFNALSELVENSPDKLPMLLNEAGANILAGTNSEVNTTKMILEIAQDSETDYFASFLERQSPEVKAYIYENCSAILSSENMEVICSGEIDFATLYWIVKMRAINDSEALLLLNDMGEYISVKHFEAFLNIEEYKEITHGFAMLALMKYENYPEMYDNTRGDLLDVIRRNVPNDTRALE